MNEVRRTLLDCSNLELALEIVGNGRSGVVDKLAVFEPIPMGALLEEASSRFGQSFDTSESFVDFVSQPDQGLSEGAREVFLRIVKVKKIEANFRR